jgi:hydrogenase maturation protein HypF
VVLAVRGVIQGVGFRPFVAREARRRSLCGSVRNARGSVEIEVQGASDTIDDFVTALRTAPPPLEIHRIEAREVGEQAEHGFRIAPSTTGEPVEPSLPADLAPCVECAREVHDAEDRRYRYPFTTCVRCGPRYTIVEALPYDRERTSMRHFAPCELCRAEYGDASDRRCHAEAIACPTCGPVLEFLDARGITLARADAALSAAAATLREGRILALKGLGGFQLLVRAADTTGVAELRLRKRRAEKPFAIMFPGIEALERVASPSEAEAALLLSPEAPIVLVARREAAAALGAAVAPANPRLGAMLPSTPLHALLLAELGEPVVCTSGNMSSEPLCTDLAEALERLAGLADRFLTHDRPIVRPMDDSVARVSCAGVELLRRARGYAPKPVARVGDDRVILALGAQQKSTVSLVQRGRLLLTQHLGDLGHPAALCLLERTVEDLLVFFAATPELVACDKNPDYASTRLAERLAERFAVPLVRVQHHAAHVAAACAEHALAGPVLGLAWDGTGLGDDGTIWGSESLVLDGALVTRAAHLAPIPLLGGDRAAREPWRSALGALWLLGEEVFERRAGAWLSASDLRVVRRALERGLNVVPCTSIGRLFDAVAALLGIRDRCGFEGQAAMELEYLAETSQEDGAYALPLSESDPRVADTASLLRSVLEDLDRGSARALIARRFHGALAAHACDVAQAVGLERVVLSGGCFQNGLLARSVRGRLEDLGFRLHTAQGVPCNDGGISVGQALMASRCEVPGTRHGSEAMRAD